MISNQLPSSDETTLERIDQLLGYLEAYHTTFRAKPIFNLKDYHFHLPLVELPHHPHVLHNLGPGFVLDPEELFELSIRKPRPTPPPQVPEDLLPYIRTSSEPTQEPEPKDDFPEEDSELSQRLRKLWSSFLDEWRVWAENERPAREVLRLYNKLHVLHRELQRDGESMRFLICSGVFTGDYKGERVSHPMLLRDLEIDFDPATEVIRLKETGATTSLHDAFLPNALGDQPGWLDSVKKQIFDDSIHPLGGEETFEFLRSLTNRIAPNAEFSSDAVPPQATSIPVVHYAPIILLRDKGAGYRTFVEAARGRLRAGQPLNQVLCHLVGSSPSGEANKEEEAPFPSVDILFARSANTEQLAAAEHLEREHGVLVQGPPGTGKTHTIANIIGHYLAQGRSILVTAHTAKALRVLRSHLPEPLQSLCVNVLDSDGRSREELKASANEINRRLAENPQRLKKKARAAEEQRKTLLRTIEQKRSEFIRELGSEYRNIIISGEAIAPIPAAREVAEGIGKNDWIPGDVKQGTPCPLSREELDELYRLNAEIPREVQRALGASLPDPMHLLPPDEFASTVKRITELRLKSEEHQQADWDRPVEQLAFEPLASLQGELEELASALLSMEPWLQRLSAIQALQNPKVEAWVELLEQLNRLHTLEDQAHALFMRHDPQLPGSAELGEVASVLDAIRTHLKSNQRLGFFKLLLTPSWKKVIEGCRVAPGKSPTSLEEFEALLSKAQIELETRRLTERWDRQVPSVEGPTAEEIGGLLSNSARDLVRAMESALSLWESKWVPLDGRLRELGFQGIAEKPDARDPDTFTQQMGHYLRKCVAPKLDAAINYREYVSLHKSLQEEIAKVAERHTSSDLPHPLIRTLSEALRGRNVAEYRAAYEQLVHICSFARDRRRRDELLERLRAAAPSWASQIENRRKPHDGSTTPGDPLAAWRWRQLHDELERRTRIDIDDLSLEIRDLENQLEQTTTDLIENRAWAAQIERTGLEERSALSAYVQAMRRYGRGTGKSASYYLRTAQHALRHALRAVPVWIMPLDRVYETFVDQDVQFDLLIVDEASQCDPRTLATFTLAKKVLVVGDDEQVSPDAIGEKFDEVRGLIDAHLSPEIPNRQLLDGRTSIYDLAKRSFRRQQRLLEHFRCVPEIIEFSNHLSYDGEIKPLRDATDLVIRPFTVEHVVRNGYIDGGVNHAEAMEIIALISAAIEQPEYKGKTFGVVTLHGNKQAPYIDKLLHEHLAASTIESRKILCGTPAHFQGDERDVIFLSLVMSPLENGGPLRLFSEGAGDANKKRLNVAASRARDQLWVVHSLDADVDLKAEDLRRRLIMHVRNPRSFLDQKHAAMRKAESEFERRVIADLTGRGFKLRPQYEVGYYRIDIVVYGREGQKVAIECDGDRFHSSEEAIRNDYDRQKLLGRLGWKFIRIRGSEYFRDPRSTIERVEDKLRQMGIEPILNSTSSEYTAMAQADSELRDRVRRRAWELLESWKHQENHYW